ncbi:MAG TPA: EF-hand domain-containing protein [Cellvibrio sp.]|nr:EF-hand domain-containing protein [Cellvibrio sp.]
MKQNLFQVGLLAGLVLALSACQSTPSANKTQAQADRSKHQKDHGASASHRAAFIDDYDLNGDEVVARAEYEQARAEKLNAMDANGNGLVDESEYLDHFAQTLEKKISAERKAQVEQTEIRFKSIDTNGDGKMTWDEYWASGAKTFTHFAKSIDGVVTLDAKDKEWDAAPSAQQDANQQQGVSLTPAADVIRPSVLRMPSSHSLEGFIDINDLDGDQQVTAAEFKQIRRGIFDATDTNKDGWVNPEEYTLEFTDRLDRLAKQVRTGQMKQAKVRYETLNINKDAGITVEEFAVSGTRIFDGWDLNNDGQVTATDPLPQIKTDSKKSTASLANASAKSVKQ